MSKFRENHVASISIDQLGLPDPQPDEAFDHVCRMITQVLGVPVSLLSIVDFDKDRQVFKGQIGLKAEPFASQNQTPLSHSFCQHVVATRMPLVVEDARLDQALANNDAVRDLGVIAYLGTPVAGPAGEIVGALCAIDSQPRVWSEAEVSFMMTLGQMVGETICLKAATLAGDALIEGSSIAS